MAGWSHPPSQVLKDTEICGRMEGPLNKRMCWQVTKLENKHKFAQKMPNSLSLSPPVCYSTYQEEIEKGRKCTWLLRSLTGVFVCTNLNIDVSTLQAWRMKQQWVVETLKDNDIVSPQYIINVPKMPPWD